MSDTTREAVARESYKLGFADGLKADAQWRDGHEEVGTCGTTLKDAVAKIERTWNYSPPLLASSPREPESGDGREALEEIKKLAAQYEADPVNAHDRPSSWDKLGALLEAIRRAAPRTPEPESR